VRVWLALAVGAAVCATASAGVERHFVETATKGGVRTQFSYDYSQTRFRFSHLHLKIDRAGAALLDSPVRPLHDAYDVQPGSFRAGKSVSVADLDGSGEPEVVLYLYWGGAHCCWYTQVYRYASATNSYSLSTHIWGNPAARSVDLGHDGRPEFVSGDDRFPYEFADFADSSWPVSIWAYRAGTFTNVTRRFPATIRADARRQWGAAFSRHNAGRTKRGVLAAWAADECLLGRCGFAFRRLESLRKGGQLGLKDACCGERSPREYLAHLRRFLKRTGYLR
jgi:hypothetical protein